ncbi:carbohydrate kinase [Actinotalea sp. C106]|uniref:carbohydrate kinase family protein n=1 Tax=Actinotalea sp. C106 TaxID=2908644 RepID=UPI0027E19511|nr:carbohydrate kinase [Actinotalea sp. C106]
MTEPASPTEHPDGPAIPDQPGAEPVGLDAPPSGVIERDRTEGAMDPGTEPSPEVMVDESERRALVIGEALIDVVRRPDGSTEEHPGGSPANVALGLARLGRPVDLLTWFGPDAHGDLLRGHLSGNGVTISPGSDSAERTSVATATLDEQGTASYDFDLSWHVPERWAAPVTPPLVVHTGSIAAVLEPGGPDVAHVLEARRESATITYDPNLRPSLMPPADQTREVVERLVALADVVKVSDEDLAWLEPGVEPLEIARRWVQAGPALVVVTRGGEGATGILATGHEVDVAAPRVTVADTVGAGDSFMGGLIDGLWSAQLLGAENREALNAAPAETLRGVLERCAEIAAITVSRAGANPPNRSEVTEA